MAEPNSEEDGILQEWESETDLLMQIPLKIPRGIFSRNLNLTCIDFVSDYIALGTNCGLIYWYNRSTNDMQKLHFENSNNIVTCVKIVSTVDFMVAGGTNTGNVTVFQIPKLLPDSVSQNLKHKRLLERFTINGLHTAPVTVIEWSLNGMKLFSGDKNGLVVLTEIDFYMHISKSMELLNEKFEIVQLSYSQQILLISTTFRSIICDGFNNWKVHQVGTKERKILGKFGATFCNFGHEFLIYASRPGHRIWLADTSGIVQKTLLFKSVISSSYPKIQLINPVGKVEYYNTSFGRLKQFGDKLIAYNSEIMYVLNPHRVNIVSVLDSARGIVDLAVNNEEIFILEEERSLLRIAYEPDKHGKYTNSLETRRKSFIFDELASKLKDTAMESLKKFTSELAITPERLSPNSPPVLADEALNLPPIVNLPSESISTIITENVEVHFSVEVNETRIYDKCLENNIATEEIEDETDMSSSIGDKVHGEIISRPLRRRNPKKVKAITVIRGPESESDTTSNASDDRVVWDTANEPSVSEESKESFSQSQSSFSILQDIPIILAIKNLNETGLDLLQDEESKTNDDKSEISLDTCESVSEQLRITPEKFSEEQERTFFRLANQDISALDSYDSEKTDNMSISLNMTSSSSVSSKISDIVQSYSEASENISLLSESKTENSGSTSSSRNDGLPLPKHLCFFGLHGSKTENEYNQENMYQKWRNMPVLYKETQRPDLCPDCSTSQTTSDNNTFIVERKKKPNRMNFEERNHSAEPSCSETEKDTQGANSGRLNDIEGMVVTENKEHFEDSGRNELSNSILGGSGLNREKLFENMMKTGHSSSESLNYGPSRNSQNCVLELSSSVDYTCRFKKKAELSVQWVQYLAPAPIICLAVSSSYVVCVDHKGQVSFSGLAGLSLSWNPLTYKATWINVSDNGSVVWILDKKNFFSLLNPSKKGPFADDILQQNVNVKHFAIDNQNPEGWLIKVNGQIYRQRNLLGTPPGKLEHIPCDWLLKSVACWNGVVLGITLDGNVVCKPSNEERFRSVTTPTVITNYIEMGPDDLAWIVDDRNNIFFSDDFLNDDSHWWEILISECIFQNPSSLRQNIQSRFRVASLGEHINLRSTMVACNENSVWVFDKFSATLRVNKMAVTGYMWNRTNLSVNLPLVKWNFICASGVSNLRGHFWLVSTSGDLFGSTPNSTHFQSVSMPFGDIRCLSSSFDVLWVLCVDGGMYCRLGLNDKNLIGSSWKELNLREGEDIRFVWISCSQYVAWGCDAQGKIYITTESPLNISTKFANFRWLEVKGNPRQGALFEKVFVGPDLCMVWAIDNKQNVYVREGIFPHLKAGTGWLYVSGIQATMLAVSESSVWAITSNGSLYRRYGTSEINYTGDYWMQIPGSLKFVSSSSTDELWGIDRNNDVSKLSLKTKIFAKKKVFKDFSEPTSFNETENDWEIPENITWSCNRYC